MQKDFVLSSLYMVWPLWWSKQKNSLSKQCWALKVHYRDLNKIVRFSLLFQRTQNKKLMCLWSVEILKVKQCAAGRESRRSFDMSYYMVTLASKAMFSYASEQTATSHIHIHLFFRQVEKRGQLQSVLSRAEASLAGIGALHLSERKFGLNCSLPMKIWAKSLPVLISWKHAVCSVWLLAEVISSAWKTSWFWMYIHSFI